MRGLLAVHPHHRNPRVRLRTLVYPTLAHPKIPVVWRVLLPGFGRWAKASVGYLAVPRQLKIHFELRVRRAPQSRDGLVRATHVGPDSFVPGQVPSSDW